MKIAFNPSTVAALTTPPNNKDITFDLRGRNIFARGVKFCGTDTWRDIKINNVSIDSNTLDLRNGSNTTLTNTNGVVTINSTWRPVVDNLTSNSTTSSLSANLGRVLKALIDGKSDSGHTHDDRYLRLTGGWMSGDINFGDDNKIYWGRNTDSASISFKNDGDGDADSYMSFVTSDNGNEYFRWSHSSGSTNTEWMALRSDGLRVGGTKVSLEGHSHNDLYYTKSETDGKYVTLTTPLTIGGSKTFTTGIRFNTNKNGDANLGSGDGFKLFYNEMSGSNFPGYYYNVASFMTGYTGFLLACYGGYDLALKYRHRLDNGTWHPWKTLAFTTDIPSSLKNPYSLTLLANGTTLATYDGSVSKIVNLTYDNVGAAAKNHTHNSLEPWASYITGDSHAAALKSLFNENKTSIPRDKFISMFSATYGNGSYYMGYFLDGYENNPYGGFFVAHYDYAYYIGISNGSFTQHRLVYSTDIPNSLKNPHALTISLNGTSQGPYDGSAAKNINITPSSIGAATSGHNHDGRYVYNYGGTQMDGTSINKNALGMTTNSGITGDWWHILQAAWNGEYRWNSLIAFPTLNRNGMYYRSGLDDNTAWGSWVKLLDTNNYSSTLDSRYYTELEVNNLLDAKLNRQNLSYGTWNPRGYNLAADYYYNGGDLSISENDHKMYVSIDGLFYQNGGLYRVLDTSDVAGLKNNLTVHLHLSNTDTTWWPLIWGGSSHNNTSDSTGEVYKSYDKLSWQTSSLTLYATKLKTTNLDTLTALFHPGNDSTLKIYSGKTQDVVSDGHIGLLTSIDNTDGLTHVYPTLYGSRCVLALQPRGGSVYIGNMPNGGNSRKLNVNGDIGLFNTGSIRDLAIGGGIYWNPKVESATDGSDAASITLVKSGVAGGTTLVLSLMDDTNDTILFKTNGSARLYHNSYPILTTLNTYVNNNKGYIYGNEITLVNNADTVDGYHVTAINNKPWGTIPAINLNGYMDIGKHLEFHYDNTTGSDYSTLLTCTGNYSNIVNLPSESGTLALTKDVLIFSNENADYLNANFNNSDFSKKAASKYIECWDGEGGWWNWKAGKFMKAGSSDAYVLLGGGGHKPLSEFLLGSGSYLPYNGWWTSGNGLDVNNANGMIFAYANHKNSPFSSAWGIITTFDYTYNSAYKFLLAANGYSNAMYYRSRSNDRGGWTSWALVIDTGNIGSLTVDKSYHLRVNHSVSTNSTWSTWYWMGQSGQPNWLWGCNDGGNMYVWNPSNFSVKYATSAGSVSNSLNIFGVSYNGSAAKTVTTSTFISLLEEGTSTVTDGTMFITSVVSNSGFADTSAVNVPYKRKASCLWSYIDSKVSSKYLPLAGGTMNGNARISHDDVNLYIGRADNYGWVRTQDISSLKGTDKWSIRESGAAHFGALYIASKTDNSFNSSVIECNSTINLNYFSSLNVSLCNGGGTVQIGPYTTGDTGNNKLYVNGSEFINGASNVRNHVFADGFRHRSHNSNDSVLLAGGGYSQGVPVRYWAIYYMYIGNSSTDVTYTKRSGNYNFITSKVWESEGTVIFDISFPSGYNKNNTLIFGNGDHRTSSSWKTPVYVTITTSPQFGLESKIRVMISDDASLNTGFANIYFMCMG